MIVEIAVIVYLLALIGSLLLIAIGVWQSAGAAERTAAALERIADWADHDEKVVPIRPPRRPAA